MLKVAFTDVDSGVPLTVRASGHDGPLQTGLLFPAGSYAPHPLLVSPACPENPSSAPPSAGAVPCPLLKCPLSSPETQPAQTGPGSRPTGPHLAHLGQLCECVGLVVQLSLLNLHTPEPGDRWVGGVVWRMHCWGDGGVPHALAPPRVAMWDMQWGDEVGVGVRPPAVHSLPTHRGQQGLGGSSATAQSDHRLAVCIGPGSARLSKACTGLQGGHQPWPPPGAAPGMHPDP